MYMLEEARREKTLPSASSPADLEAFLPPQMGHGFRLVSGSVMRPQLLSLRHDNRIGYLDTAPPPSVSSRRLSGLFLWPSWNVGTELLRLAIGQGVVMGWRPNLGAGRLPKV